MTRAASVASSTLPTWTTATRPASPAIGQQGVNTTTGAVEIYSGSDWVVTAGFPYSVSYLVIAGGGGGGNNAGGNQRSGGGARFYVANYTISAANTWEQKTITVPLSAGTASGTWNTTNGSGFGVVWNLGAESNRKGDAALNSWQTLPVSGGYPLQSANQVNWLSTSGATFYITGVQLEKGSTATSFDYRPYTTELQLCQRYTYKMMRGWQLPKMRESNRSRTNSFQHPVQMRAAPSIPSLATTDGITLTLWEITDKGFYGECVVPGDGYGASVNTEAVVSAEL